MDRRSRQSWTGPRLADRQVSVQGTDRIKGCLILKEPAEACLGDGKPLLTTRVSMEEVVDFSLARPLPRPPCAPPRGRRLPGKLLLRP